MPFVATSTIFTCVSVYACICMQIPYVRNVCLHDRYAKGYAYIYLSGYIHILELQAPGCEGSYVAFMPWPITAYCPHRKV